MQTNQSQGKRNTTILPITQPEKPLPPVSPLYFQWPKRQITARWLFWLYNYISGVKFVAQSRNEGFTASPHPRNSFRNKLCFPIKSMFLWGFSQCPVVLPFPMLHKMIAQWGPLNSCALQGCPCDSSPCYQCNTFTRGIIHLSQPPVDPFSSVL